MLKKVFPLMIWHVAKTEEPGETPDADKATKDLVLQPSNDISLCIGKT